MESQTSQTIYVKDIMTKSVDVISVYPETPLIEAAQLISKHNFDGLPVVDKKNKLVGIITEYDLLSHQSPIHLPTLQLVIQSMVVHKKDNPQFQKEFEKLMALKVGDVMNSEPLTLSANATYKDALKAFQEHHRVNPIPIIDEQNKVVGVISRFDVLKPLRHFDNLVRGVTH